jgi:hypothetical protein
MSNLPLSFSEIEGSELGRSHSLVCVCREDSAASVSLSYYITSAKPRVQVNFMSKKGESLLAYL